MSNRWFYEIDGQTVGPVEQTRLRLLADSGMLEPHHNVRREGDDDWSLAGAVRGLFTPTPAPVGGLPIASVSPVARSAPIPSPISEVSSPAEMPAPAGVFDFYDEGENAAPPSSPKPTPKPAKANKSATPNPQARRKEIAAAPVPTSPAKVSPVSRANGEDPNIPEVVAEFVEEGAGPFAFEPLPGPPDLASSKTGETKLTFAQKPEPADSARAEVNQAGSTGAVRPQPVPEVAGQAVDLQPDDTLRLLDGKTTFRLYRAWLMATTKFADGTVRVAYLRLQRIDAGVVEHRYEGGRGRERPHSVLSFHAGELTASLLFEGSDKPYRAFIEKVMLHGLPAKPPTQPKS